MVVWWCGGVGWFLVVEYLDLKSNGKYAWSGMPWYVLCAELYRKADGTVWWGF